MKCSLCNFEHDDLKRFSEHVKKEHGFSSEDYTVSVLHRGVRPTCKACGGMVRYVSFSFKEFCKEHARIAMARGGARGGSAVAWNKGATQDTDERVRRQAERFKGSGNPFFGKKHTEDTIRKISDAKVLSQIDLQKRLSERSHEFKLVSDIDDYRSRQKQYLDFCCLKCGTVQPKTLQAFERGSRCYVCFPITKSNWELEVFEFVKRMFADTRLGDRTVISPKEIDVFVPSRNMGIECHGLYWHSEGSPKPNFDRKLHVKKLELASSVGVRLFQLFEDEWRDKREICESLIEHRLGVSRVRVGARKLKLKALDTEKQREFFDSSHIAGYVPATAAWGLVDDNGCVRAALSVRVPRHEKYKNMFEVARFSTSPGWSVSGALQRLVCAAITEARTRGITSIMTYVDRRLGDGHGYISCGFRLIGNTGVDYWYTDNFLRYDRFKFRARDGKSEREIAREAGVSKIWGCGSLILVLNV